MSASLGLYRLQLVDSELDKIQARLITIQQIIDDDEASRQLKQTLEETKKAYDLAVHSLLQSEQEVEKQKVKIEQSEASLYSGTVKNPKELQDLQNELAALKRHISVLEDRQLAAMEIEETKKNEYQKIQGEVAQLEQDLSKQFRTFEEERSALKKDQSRLESERLAAYNSLDSKIITLYDALRKERNGMAVVKVNEGACSACGTTLTPSQQQNARSAAQISNCPTCGRVLYAN